MTVVTSSTIPNHLDILVMQTDQEQAVVRDLVFSVLAFNKASNGEPLQVSFPLYTDIKVSTRGALGPCVRVTGPAEKLYVLTLRYEVAAHLRAGRAVTLVRDNAVVDSSRNERFALVSVSGARAVPATKLARARPLVLAGHSRLIETAGELGAEVRDEAAFVKRSESGIATDGAVDLLGFSEWKTLPVLE
jgi:hypothetical protein